MTAIETDLFPGVKSEQLAAAMTKLLAALGEASRAVAEGTTRFCNAEERVMEAVHEVGRRCMGELLSASEPGEPLVEVRGRVFQRHEKCRVTYTSLYGPVAVERWTYREHGTHNGATVVPVELRCGLIERMTPAAARATGHLVQAVPSREAAALSNSLKALFVSRSTLERVAQVLGNRWETYRDEGEQVLVETFEIPEKATSVSVSVDRVMIPMEEVRRRRPGRPPKWDTAKNPKQVTYRAAYVACWTLHDCNGEPLHTTRYGRMSEPVAQGLIEDALECDLDWLLEKRPDLALVTLADGAPEMQNMLARVAERFETTAQLVDFWHAVEYVAKALNALGRDVRKDLRAIKKTLLEEDGGVLSVLVRLLTWKTNASEVPEALTDAIRYFENQAHLMDYAAARKQGLPIGSGHVEATAKTLVTVRMKRPGARWKTETGQAILNLRSLAQSSRWDRACDFITSTYEEDVVAFQAAA